MNNFVKALLLSYVYADGDEHWDYLENGANWTPNGCTGQ